MDKLYRIIIGGFLAFLAVVFFVLSELLRSDTSGLSTTSDSPFFSLMIFISILVIIIVPAIFVVVRLIRR